MTKPSELENRLAFLDGEFPEAEEVTPEKEVSEKEAEDPPKVIKVNGRLFIREGKGVREAAEETLDRVEWEADFLIQNPVGFK